MTKLEGFIKKGWGHELIWATNEKYCGKLMKFNTGAKFSMHFHKDKDESWYVLDGEFLVHWINTLNADVITSILKTGDTWRNEPCEPHQLECIKEGTIVEVSTPDSVEDNYRVSPGDSQLKID
jgi:mannose-6-phosphate isomerase